MVCLCEIEEDKQLEQSRSSGHSHGVRSCEACENTASTPVFTLSKTGNNCKVTNENNDVT